MTIEMVLSAKHKPDYPAHNAWKDLSINSMNGITDIWAMKGITDTRAMKDMA